MRKKHLLLFNGGCLRVFAVSLALLFSFAESAKAQFPAPYCAVGFATGVEPISRVLFGTIDNASSAAIGGSAHEDFLSLSTAVGIGEAMSIAVEGNTDGTYTSQIVVFFDWNQDGDFADAGESYTLSTLYNSTGLDGLQSTGTISVPPTALVGTTRMRVVKRFSAVPGPCNTAGFGQAEDYTVTVFMPLCPAVTGVTQTALTSTSVDLSWTAGGYETSWNVEWGAPGFQPGIGNEIGAQSVSGTPEATIPGLTPETAYHIYVQADCDTDGTSTWVGPLNITTTALCPAITAITLDGLTSTSVDVSWTAGSTETSWNVEWGASGFAPGTGDEIGSQSVSGTPEITIPGLTPETTYHVYVQADCDVDGTSTWVGPLNVYTGYCTPSPSSVDGNGITNVTIGTLSNSTGVETGNYGDFSAMIETVVRNHSVNFSVTNSYNYDMWVLIDWNNNLNFNDAGEQYYIGSYNGTDDIDITIPVTASLGHHRVRIFGTDFNTTPPYQPSYACYTGAWGAFEDYTINVIDEPIAPAITQSSATPDCTTGTTLSTTGTPNAGEAWYWQTTATGTSTTNVATTPWVVLENGTYYVRTLNTTYNVWSSADSIVISNIPTAPVPPTPVAAQNPACAPGTTISVPAATGTLTYYWQGTSNTSSSTTEDAATPYNVTATGTYYVKAFDSATNCWSEPAGVLVTVDSEVPPTPTVNDSLVYACTGASSIMIEAQTAVSTMGTLTVATTGGNGCTAGAMFDVIATDNVNITGFDVYAGTTGNQNVNIYYKTGSYVGSQTNAAAWTLAGTYPINGTDGQSTFIDITDIPLVGGQSYGFFINYNADYTNVTTGTTYTDGFMTVTVGEGICTLWSTGNDGRAFNGRIYYGENIPATATWYDAATGGNVLGTDNPMETVGTSVLPTATAGEYEFYVASTLGGCQSVERALVTVNVSAVNVELTAMDASCNNGNDGSFMVANVDCGVAPFSYQVNGGAFGAIPTNLTAGTNTVVVQDANGDLSAEYTITIGSAAGPSATAVTSYTNEEAVVVWNSNGSETSWNVEWGLPGFTPGTGTEVGSATANDTTYTITGLDGSTEYDIYVSANCGSGTTTGDWASTSVTTDCDPMSAVGYCEDFEDIDALGCWRVINANGDADVWSIYTGYANSGTQSAGLYTDFNAGNNNDYLVMPRMTLTGNEILTFHYRVQSAGEPNDFRVVLSETGFEAADFTEEILPLMTASNTTYQDTSINLSAYSGDVYIAFHVPPGGLDGWYLYIDDVCIDICNPVPGADGVQDVCRTEGTVDLNTVIASPYTHGTWSFPANQSVINGSTMNVSTLANGTYDVMYVVTTACTSDTTVASITVGNPSSAGTNGVLTVCMSQFIDLYGGLNGNVDFGGTWYTPNGTAMTSSYFQTGVLPGQFVYKYIVSNGICGPDTAEVTVNILNCVGLEDVSLLENVTIAPNPNTGNFQILGVAGADYTFEVLDVNGRIIRESIKITSTTTDVNLSDVENGVYMVRIFGNNAERMMRVIKH